MTVETGVAVVGAGPAGCAAAVQCVRLGLSVALFDRTGVPGGLVAGAWRIENHPGMEAPVSGREYARRLGLMLDRFGVGVSQLDVDSLGEGRSRLLLRGAGGKTVRCRCAVLATGTRAGRAGFEGEDLGPPVFHDAARLQESHPERVLVVGGGEAALDCALGLSDGGTEVRMLIRSGRFRAAGRLPALVAARPRIEVITGAVVRRVARGAGGGARAMVELSGAEVEMEADAVMVAVGRLPEAPRLPPDAAVSGPGRVEGLRGAFCAGDLACGGLGQACTAAGQGLQAAAMAFAHLEGGGPGW